jgi:plasmid stabilization system protein ParE
MASYELSPETFEDLLRIQNFISHDNPPAAAHLIDDFFLAFERLAQWPHSGHSRTDLTSKEVLFWPIGSYLIVYRIRKAESLVQIVAVLHAARDIPAVLEDR